MYYTWENDEFIYTQILDDRGLIVGVHREKK